MRLPWMLLRTLPLAAMLAVPSARGQTVPAFDPHAPRIQHCFQTLPSDPKASAALAESVLETAQLPDTPRLGALVCLVQARLTLGQGEQAEALIAQAIPLLDAPGIPDANRFSATMGIVGVLQTIGRDRQALELLERALALAGQDGSPQNELAALLGIAMTRAIGMDDPEGAEPYFLRAITLVERHALPSSPPVLMLHYNYGYTLLVTGRHAEAEAAFERALRIARGVPGQDVFLQRILSHRGEIARVGGDTATALALLEQAQAWQDAHGDRQGEAVTLGRLARLHLDENRPRQALEAAQRALELSEGAGYQAETRDSLNLLAEVHAALGDSAQVIEFTRRARAFEQAAARQQDLERLAALQARTDTGATGRPASSRATVLRDTALAVFALLLLVLGVALLRSRRRQRQLAELGATDALTGLLNRREATRRIEALSATTPGGEARNALLLIDIDAFKAINDTHGHAVGDEALARVAERLRAACDDHDLLARWGGEEFLVVRADTSREAAFALAEHLRGAVEREAIDLPDGPALAVTVSIGLAPSPFFPAGKARWQDAIRMADRALYVAKHAGRNAWAGIWGLADGHHADLYSVRENPEFALSQGWIAIGGNRPMSWAPVRTPPPARKSSPVEAEQRQRRRDKP